MLRRIGKFWVFVLRLRVGFFIQGPLITSLFFTGALCPAISLAQDVRFEATVNAKTVALGSVLQLNLSLYGAKASSPPEVPEIDGLEIRYAGPATRVSIINGVTSSSVTYMYTLLPLKTGRFQIPALNVSVDGQTYTSSPIDVEVVPGGQPSSSGHGSEPAPSREDEATVQESLKDRMFLVMSAPKDTAYVRERIPLTIKLYISGLAAQDIQYPELDPAGWVVEDFAEARQYQEVVKGVRYDVVEFTTAVSPTKEGEWTIGPAKVSGNILSRQNTPRRPGFGGFESLFEDDFFGGVFGSYQKYPMTVSSQTLTVAVKPLPAEGRPEAFSGAVGQFEFHVTAAPLEVQEGDPVTLTMSVTGNGSLDGVTLPVLKDSEAFKTYDPIVKGKGGSKTIEQVIIPQSDKVREIPALPFSYFDTDSSTYRTLSQGPWALVVKKAADSGSFMVVEKTPAGDIGQVSPGISETFGRDIVFIKERPGTFRKRGAYFYKDPILYGLIVLSLIGWGAVAFVSLREQRIRTDTGYARRLKAPKKARSGLQAAKHFLEAGKAAAFYDMIFKTLTVYLGDRYHLPLGSVTAEAVAVPMKKEGVNGQVLSRLKEIFEACEAVRYASVQQDRDKMQAVCRACEEVIDKIERAGK